MRISEKGKPAMTAKQFKEKRLALLKTQEQMKEICNYAYVSSIAFKESGRTPVLKKDVLAIEKYERDMKDAKAKAKLAKKK